MEIINQFSYKIYYSDTDAGGVLYYSKYLDFLEKARTDFLEQSGINSTSLHNQNIFLAVREVKAEYLKPVFYGEIILISISLKELKKTNFILEYDTFKNNSLIFKGSTKLVCVNSTLKVIKLPEQIYEFLQRLLK